MSNVLPRVIVHEFPQPAGDSLLRGKVEMLPWSVAINGTTQPVDGIYLFGHKRIDAALLDRLPGLRIISNFGVGVDHIDVDACAARGIKVGNTPHVLDQTVADIAFALVLAASRRIVEGDKFARGEGFKEFKVNLMLARDVHHTTLGIVGLGSIGWQIARRARGFDMSILYHNRRPRPDAEKEFGARYASLEQLLRESDHVVLILPLTPQTRGLIGRDALALMKPTATLVNMARGPVVDTAALTDALREKRIYAAALDVTDPEPLPRDHPLLFMDNVIITPHMGSGTLATRQKMAEISVENLLRGLRGEPLLHEVKRGQP